MRGVSGGSLKGKLLYLLSWVVVALPSALKLPIYRHVFKYDIGPGSKIGVSWIHVRRLQLGQDVIIGHLNRFKNIPDVSIGDCCLIGNLNTFTSTEEFTNEHSVKTRKNRPALHIGKHVGISMLHYFDVQDTLSIGAFTTVTGNGSTFFTHQLDVTRSEQSARPIAIGSYCMIGSNARFVPGSSIPDCCVVGMGSVVTRSFVNSYRLIGGNPAVEVAPIPDTAAYFHRQVGWISSFAPPPYRRA